MSYLRFTPDEYLMIAALCNDRKLGQRHQPAFKRLLVESLREADPALADRIARLGREKSNLLYWHFRERTPTAPKTRPTFSAEELRLVAEAFASTPYPVRLVRPFKRFLVEQLQAEWPGLARKLARLSGVQFEQLYEQIVCERRSDGV